MKPSTADNPASPFPVPVPLDEMANEQRVTQGQVFHSKVYCATVASGWIVEPPRNMVSVVDKKVFTGPKAQKDALTYAYETFGNARFFPY